MSNSTLIVTTLSWTTALPDNFRRIGISRGVPRRGPGGYKMYRALQPGEWWADCTSNEEFREHYFARLAQLCPQRVILDLIRIADGKIPALLCWESPAHSSEWCHRGLVAAWLHDELGLEVKEFGHEDEGWGWAHPKLPPEFRRQA